MPGKDREYRVIFLGPWGETRVAWRFLDLDSLEKAQALLELLKTQAGIADAFLRQHLVVIDGSKSAYDTLSEAAAAAEKRNTQRPNSAEVMVLYHEDCPANILYGS
jgi:hypothetical protein